MTPYPPERNAWQFPPPPVSRRWFWVAIAVIVLSVAVGGGMAIAGVSVAAKDFPSVIEDHQLIDVITQECAVMTATVESMPVDGSPKQQAAILADQDQSVEQMVQAIRLVDPHVRAADKPTDQWLDDWDRLLDARKSYAVLVERGYRPSLRIPRDGDGDPIYRRMNDVWLTTTACRVPRDLLIPYPPDVDGV
ncbi:MAG: hypothetical protein QOJ72_1647 [Nocardioidaceae bacterium]|nr:hypothetical protein [Nocardioidaceae bacterium]